MAVARTEWLVYGWDNCASCAALLFSFIMVSSLFTSSGLLSYHTASLGDHIFLGHWKNAGN